MADPDPTVSLFRKHGAHTFPAADTDETTLASLDPARDIVLGLLAAALNAEIGPEVSSAASGRWADAIANTPLSATTNPVQSKHPFPPSEEFLQTIKTGFPALFVDRQTSEWDEYSIERLRRTCSWRCDYILGAMSPGTYRKLFDVLPFASAVIAHTLREGGHKAYATHSSDRTDIPRLVLGTGDVAGLAQFSRQRVRSERYGAASFTEGGTVYWACSVVFETVELGSTRAGFGSPFDATDYRLSPVGEGGKVPDLVRASTDVPYQDG